MDRPGKAGTRLIGCLLIGFAIGFNLPYVWLARRFGYPDILRDPPGVILEAFAAGGDRLILVWAAFAFAALAFAPVAVGVAAVTRRPGHPTAAIAALGVAAAVTQAIGLSRWVFAVPGLAAGWMASTEPAARAEIETVFAVLHQFAGVGIGEAIGQTLTGFWLLWVGLGQCRHPRFGLVVGLLGALGGATLLLGPAEGLATVLAFDPGPLGHAALAGFLILSVWMVWTGLLCLLRPGTDGWSER